jgi:hypothetical protein
VKNAGGLLFNAIWIAVALIGVTLAQSFYTYQVQMPRCYEYARQKALPHIERLQFDGVVVANKNFRGHLCRFLDADTGLPVRLEFDEADVPYGMDTLQVMCMVGVFLIIGLPAMFLYYVFRKGS